MEKIVGNCLGVLLAEVVSALFIGLLLTLFFVVLGADDPIYNYRAIVIVMLLISGVFHLAKVAE